MIDEPPLTDDELLELAGVDRDEAVIRAGVNRELAQQRRRVDLELPARRMTPGELRVHLEVDHDTPADLVGTISVTGCRMLHEGAHSVRVGRGKVIPDAAPPEHLELVPEGRR